MRGIADVEFYEWLIDNPQVQIVDDEFDYPDFNGPVEIQYQRTYGGGVLFYIGRRDRWSNGWYYRSWQITDASFDRLMELIFRRKWPERGMHDRYWHYVRFPVVEDAYDEFETAKGYADYLDAIHALPGDGGASEE